VERAAVADLESTLRLLADPPPAVPLTGTAAVADLLVRRGVLDRLVADAVLDDPAAARHLAGLRAEVATRFEDHVLNALGRLPSWYRVRIGDPGRPAGAWIDRHGRPLRVEVHGSPRPPLEAVGRGVVDEPVLLIVPGAQPAGADVDRLRARHRRLVIMSWDLDHGRLQQVIEGQLRVGGLRSRCLAHRY
jgi:hypothetical protein